jgi:hypothetical protein
MESFLLMKLWASESSVREALDTSLPRIIPETRWFGNRIIGTGYRLQDTGDRGLKTAPYHENTPAESDESFHEQAKVGKPEKGL